MASILLNGVEIHQLEDGEKLVIVDPVESIDVIEELGELRDAIRKELEKTKKTLLFIISPDNKIKTKQTLEKHVDGAIVIWREGDDVFLKNYTSREILNIEPSKEGLILEDEIELTKLLIKDTEIKAPEVEIDEKQVKELENLDRTKEKAFVQKVFEKDILSSQRARMVPAEELSEKEGWIKEALDKLKDIVEKEAKPIVRDVLTLVNDVAVSSHLRGINLSVPTLESIDTVWNTIIEASKHVLETGKPLGREKLLKDLEYFRRVVSAQPNGNTLIEKLDKLKELIEKDEEITDTNTLDKKIEDSNLEDKEELLAVSRALHRFGYLLDTSRTIVLARAKMLSMGKKYNYALTYRPAIWLEAFVGSIVNSYSVGGAKQLEKVLDEWSAEATKNTGIKYILSNFEKEKAEALQIHRAPEKKRAEEHAQAKKNMLVES